MGRRSGLKFVMEIAVGTLPHDFDRLIAYVYDFNIYENGFIDEVIGFFKFEMALDNLGTQGLRTCKNQKGYELAAPP